MRWLSDGCGLWFCGPQVKIRGADFVEEDIKRLCAGTRSICSSAETSWMPTLVHGDHRLASEEPCPTRELSMVQLRGRDS